MRGGQAIDMLSALDRFVADMCEDLYLWCFDRTGISLANAYTIVMLTIPVARVLSGQANWMAMLPLAAVVICVGHFVGYGQRRMSKQAWNACVEGLRTAPLRQVIFSLVVVMSFAVVFGLLTQGHTDAPALLAVPTAFYLFLVRQRDRQPPQKKSFKPAFDHF
jgi:DMSO/TMAO reductase YedYZ heme-binding membrane subunit